METLSYLKYLLKHQEEILLMYPPKVTTEMKQPGNCFLKRSLANDYL